MPRNSLFRATSWNSLYSAWKNLHSKSRPSSRNTIGVDDLSINDFARDDKANVNKLYSEIRKGDFHFSRLRPHLIAKPNGKDRLICIPTVKDRIVQRALLEYLSTKYQERIANKVSFGFVRNRDVSDAVTVACARRKKHPWVFKTDITAFFDSVDRSRLVLAIKRSIREKSLYKILFEALGCEVQCPSSNVSVRIKKLGIKEGFGIRQGMPLSPFFANLLLLQFDDAIQKKKYECVRYADDLIFFADSKSECQIIAEFCSEELGKLGLVIPKIENGSKSIIYDPKMPADFLGLGLCLENGSYVLRLMPSQLERIRDNLLKMASIKELLSRKIKLENLGRAIESRKSGYIHAYADCVNAVDLENELANIQQKVLKKIYVEGLCIDIRKLPAEARTFIGLA